MSLSSWLRNLTAQPRQTRQRSRRSRPLLELLEDRLAPGSLGPHIGGALDGDPGTVQFGPGLTDSPASGNHADHWQAAALDTQPTSASGGNVLPATANLDGYSLADMTAATAQFLTSGTDPSLYPNTPFQILYHDPARETVTFPSPGVLVARGVNEFTVKPGTPFYVPLGYSDDSPPIIGTFPTTQQAVADYMFDHDQNGFTNLQIVVDGHTTAIGPAYVGGLVQTSPLQDGGGTHMITIGAFLTPLSPGVHTVTISGMITGLTSQAVNGFVVDFASTYTITVTPH